MLAILISHMPGSARPLPPSSTTADADSNRVLQALRSAHDAVEQTVANEIAKAFGNSSQQKAQLDEARGQIIALQKDLEKMTQQKNYVADAFEASWRRAVRHKYRQILRRMVDAWRSLLVHRHARWGAVLEAESRFGRRRRVRVLLHWRDVAVPAAASPT